MATKRTSTKPATMYGAMIDHTGVTARPKKLHVEYKGRFHNARKGAPLKAKKAPEKEIFGWNFGYTTFVKKAGEKTHGDGKEFRITFCDPDKKKVELWFKGVQAMRKLLLASLTEGK